MEEEYNEFYVWNLQTNVFLEELLSSIRLRPIPWIGHLRAGLVTDEEVKMIKALDWHSRKRRSLVLMKESKEYAELFLTLFQRFQRIDLLQYLLTLCSDLLDDVPKFSNVLLLYKNKENFPFSPLMRLLKHDDQIISLLSGKIMSSLVSAAPIIPTTTLSWFFEWISSLCQSPDHNIQDLAVQALTGTLKNSFNRLRFWKESTYMQNLIYKKWLDKEAIEDIEFVKTSLKADLEGLATFDEYVLEIESGHLSWTPSHSSEKFWKENAFKLMNNDCLLLKKLVRLLLASKDPLVLAVAIHDIGKFIQQYPNGKLYAQKLGAKQKIMELMTHSDSDVKYEALTTVRQFMLQP
ncbi:unnamed protein product, partial [Pneumocystis jirovecii]